MADGRAMYDDLGPVDELAWVDVPFPRAADSPYVEIRQASRTHTRLVDGLLVVGLLLGLATMLMDSRSLAQHAQTNWRDVHSLMVMPAGYREIKMLELACALLAGVLAYRSEGKRCMSLPGRLAFIVLLLWMSGHCLLEFRSGFSRAELVGAKGPAVWWVMLVLFAGCSSERWNKLTTVFAIVVAVGCTETLFRVTQLVGQFGREEAARTLRCNLSLLMWTTPVVAFVSARHVIGKMLRFIPIGCILLGSVVTATRSWLVLSFLYLVIFVYVQTLSVMEARARVEAVCFVLVAMVIVFFLLMCFCGQQLTEGADILLSRITFDSRSWQLEEFFANVRWDELLIGTGPRGTWKMGHIDYGYVDGAYFFLLFLGGAPLLISYLAVIVAPAILCAARYRLSTVGTVQFACMASVLLWGLALTGLSTFTCPDTDICHTTIALCAGRCWGALAGDAEEFEWTSTFPETVQSWA